MADGSEFDARIHTDMWAGSSVCGTGPSASGRYARSGKRVIRTCRSDARSGRLCGVCLERPRVS